MRRKFVYTVLLLGIVLASSIYWVLTIGFNYSIVYNNVIQIKKYSVQDLLLKPANSTCANKLFVIIIVTSYVGHVELRNSHRKAMPADSLKKNNAARVFLLAQVPEREKYITQAAIIEESNKFGDTLQGSFAEHYRNLTYKHLMGLQWASTICSDAKFILKVDDDTVFNLDKTYELLKNVDYTTEFLMGYMLNNTKPKRDKDSKWYVTWDEYPRTEYPPYLTGWYYITTPKTAAKICDEALYHPFFWIDDIFVTGLLTEALDVKLRQLPDEYNFEYYGQLK